MMKKNYIEPSVIVVAMKLSNIICGSKDITSDKGVDYGGVDEDGVKDPASRRKDTIWEDEEDY